MKFNLGNKIIGGYRLNKSFFLHSYNKDNNINKSWVISLGIEKEIKPWITYEYDYQMLNLFFMRLGFSISEVM